MWCNSGLAVKPLHLVSDDFYVTSFCESMAIFVVFFTFTSVSSRSNYETLSFFSLFPDFRQNIETNKPKEYPHQPQTQEHLSEHLLKLFPWSCLLSVLGTFLRNFSFGTFFVKHSLGILGTGGTHFGVAPSSSEPFTTAQLNVWQVK